MADEPKKSGGIQIPGTKVKVPPKVLLIGGVALIAILVLTQRGGGGSSSGESVSEIPQPPDDKDSDGGSNQGILDALTQFGQQQAASNTSLLTAIQEGFQGLSNADSPSTGGGGWTGGGGEVGGGGGGYVGMAEGFPAAPFFGGGDSLAMVDAPIENEISSEKGSLSGTPTPRPDGRRKPVDPKDPKNKTPIVKKVITPSGMKTIQNSAGGVRTGVGKEGKADKPDGFKQKPAEPKNRQPEVKKVITPSGPKTVSNTSGGQKKPEVTAGGGSGKAGKAAPVPTVKPTQPTQPKKPAGGGGTKKGK